MAIVNYPEFLQTQTYAAQRLRYQQELFTPNGEGVMGQADFRVSQRGAGANMSVDVAAGDAVVRGDTITRQGLYHIVNDATINAAITANASGNPRIDRITLQCSDSTDSGSGTDISVINVIAGTPTGGATLDNLSGVAAVPNNQLLLADVVVANGAASIVDANIRSRRSVARPEVIPTLTGVFDVDMVPFIPHPALPVSGVASQIHNSHDLFQVAALMWLPRRIVGATKLRWRYVQNATTANTGNYIFGIYDASGRQVAATASTALAGATSSVQVRSEALTATTTFEAGMYYVMIGFDTATAGGAIAYPGIGAPDFGIETVGAVGAWNAGLFAGLPGTLLRSTTGGVTLPATNTILGFTDVGAQASLVTTPGVPLCALSVT